MLDSPAILGGEPLLKKSEIQTWPRGVGEETVKKISNLLLSGNFAMGEQTKNFETLFAEYCGSNFSVLVSSGSEALSLALNSLDLEPDDEIIIPALGFISNLSTVLLAGAKPILADVEAKTGNICPDSVSKLINKKTRAVVVIAYGGLPYDPREIKVLVRDKKIALIEDASHAHGAEFEGNKIGSFGDFGCFSFDQNKLITSGQGGALITNSEENYLDLLKRRNFGLDRSASIPQWMYFPLIASNCKPTDIMALMLNEQLDSIDQDINYRKYNYLGVSEKIRCLPGLEVIKPNLSHFKESHYLMRFKYNSEEWNGLSRDLLIKSLLLEGVPVGPGWPPLSFRLHDYPQKKINNKSLAEWKRVLPNAYSFSSSAIVLPNELLMSSKNVIDKVPIAFKRVYEASDKIRKEFPNFSSSLLKYSKIKTFGAGLSWLSGNYK